jgi:hypothetical protein
MMITSNRLEGLRDIARYYAELVSEGRIEEYIEMLIYAQRRLKRRMEKKEEKTSVMATIKQTIQARIKHNEARLLWKKGIDFTNMSHAARSFSAAQASSWVSEIYFLKGLLGELEKAPEKECKDNGCENCSGKGECHH